MARASLAGVDGWRMDLASQLVIYEIVSTYYSHPYAWGEIGFPGPRFPRIYARTTRVNPGEAEEAPQDAA